MTQLAALHKIPEDAKGRRARCWVSLHLQHLTLLISHPLQTFMDKQLLEKGWVYREPSKNTESVKNLHLQSIHWGRKCCLPESHFRGRVFSTTFAFLGIFSLFPPVYTNFRSFFNFPAVCVPLMMHLLFAIPTGRKISSS